MPYNEKNMNSEKAIIKKTVQFVKQELGKAEVGHDWWHIYRVWKLARYIAKKEKVNLFVVELGVLLHDIADRKFYDGDENIGPEKAKKFLQSLEVDSNVIEHIEAIIRNISFKGVKSDRKFHSPELNVAQDADRLDALGAIGIARAFVFAGNKGLTIHDPEISPNMNMDEKEYKNYRRQSYTQINHFYEKLLLLKDLMNTKTGKKIAERRHKFMEDYLKEFYKEWDGKA